MQPEPLSPRAMRYTTVTQNDSIVLPSVDRQVVQHEIPAIS